MNPKFESLEPRYVFDAVIRYRNRIPMYGT